nr:hypothetical protein MSRaV_46R [Micropterus salmoides ranavirus]WHA35639.1 hypothetical protein SCRaV_46R [Siniperca chuatsi ranavirus]
MEMFGRHCRRSAHVHYKFCKRKLFVHFSQKPPNAMFTDRFGHNKFFTRGQHHHGAGPSLHHRQSTLVPD